MKTVLITEDDRIVARIYENKLRSEGFAVEIADDGESALEKIEQAKPDLVILDLGLPKISGLEVLKSVRARPESKDIPVIVLSNGYVTDLVQAAWKGGATRCLTKGTCTPRQMLDIIHTLLEPTPSAPIPASPWINLPSPGAPVPDKSLTEMVESTNWDGAFQLRVRAGFTSNAPSLINELQSRLTAVVKSPAPTSQTLELLELYRAAHTLAGLAGIAEFKHIAQLATALEALVKELYEQPKKLGISPVRTIASALDSLKGLIARAAVSSVEEDLPPLVLVLDDDVICRRAITHALDKARLRSLSVEDPHVALSILEENPVSLVFSDINMPQMSGFDFCEKLRLFPKNVSTPVVFVTTSADFKNRATTKLRGGIDLIAKPFLLLELAVKALTFLLPGTLPTPAGIPSPNAAPAPAKLPDSF